MSVTFLENLWADGDTPSGDYIRGQGIITRSGKIKPVIGSPFGVPLVLPAPQTRDAFARLKVSQPFNMFDSKQVFAKDTFGMVENLVSGATANYNSTTGCVDMVVPTTSGALAQRQSRIYIPYQPGRATYVMTSVILGDPVTNVRKRVGIFDDNNGFFLEQVDGGTDGDLRIVRRSNASGVVVDEVVGQDNWNIDRLDGTGGTDINLDVSKIQLFIFDFTWLGAGELRFGAIVDGELNYAHQFDISNVTSEVSMRTPVLPIRYEIENLDTSVGDTLQQICCAAFSEGGLDPLGFPAVVSNGATLRSIGSGSSLPLVAIRLRSGFTRGLLIPINVALQVNTADNLFYELLLGATVTGGAWNNAGQGSEVNVTGTAISGGNVIQAGYLNQDTGVIHDVVRSNVYASANFDGTIAETIVMNVSSISTAANAGAAIIVKEIL